MKQVDRDYLDLIQSRYPDFEADYATLAEKIKTSEAYYKGEPVPYVHMPRFFPDDEVDCVRDIIDTSVRIFRKVIDRYVADGQYRKPFGFSQALEELILLPTPIPEVFPMARFDFLFDDCNTFRFVELNTDGSSAMVEDRTFVQLFRESLAYEEFSKQYELKSFDLVGEWVTAIREIYQELYRDELPTIAIVDYFDEPNPEFLRFQTEFIRAGMPTVIAQPNELTYHDDYLYYGDQRIDVVYRRLVTSDFMKHYEELSHLVEALKYGKTLWVGPIRSQVIHNKILFAVLHREEFWPMFTEAEVDFIRRHVPYTVELTNENRNDERFQEKDRWIIKPVDSYASKGVVAGRAVTQQEWRDELQSDERGRSIIQEYSDMGLADMVYFEGGGIQQFRQMIGFFVYRGQFAGFYTRVGQHSIVSGAHNGRVTASFESKKRV